MTILADRPDTPQHPGWLSSSDILDIASAVRTAAAADSTSIDARDRHALTLATYMPGTGRFCARLIENILDGSTPLPLSRFGADKMLDLIDRLPDVTGRDESEWWAARQAEKIDNVATALHEASTTSRLHPDDKAILRAHLIRDDAMSPVERDVVGCIVTGLTHLPVDAAQALVLRELADRLTNPAPERTLADQVVTALAGYAASRIGEPGNLLLNGAVQTAIRVAQPDIPITQVPRAASEAVGDALADLDADGLIPPPSGDPVERAMRIIAAEAARHCDSAGTALRWALRTLLAELDHDGSSPVTDDEHRAAHDRAHALVEELRAERLAVEYGEQPLAVTR